MFTNFLKNGKMTSTYKIVFLRALLDLGEYDKNLVGRKWIGHRDDKTVLDLNFIAIRFAKYYWDLDISFGMKHMPDRMGNNKKPSRGIKAVTLIKTEIEKMQLDNRSEMISDNHPPTLYDLASDEMNNFRTELIKIIKATVLKAILTDMKGLYTIAGKQHIELDSDLIGFMKSNSTIIKYALNYVLAQYLERYNQSARNIAIKINHEMSFENKLELLNKINTSHK